MSSKRRLSQNLASSANKLRLDSINKILKIDSVKGKKQRKDAISRQVSRIALTELIRNSPQASRVVTPDFKTFLMHDDNVKVFGEFLKASYCQENLDFWLACERYRKLDPNRVGKQMIKFMATQIYNDFLGDEARQPVNVDSKCVESIRNRMRDPQPDLLREAQADIFTLMKTDCYPRFCKTWQLDKSIAHKILERSSSDTCQTSHELPSQQTPSSASNQSHDVTSTTLTSTRDSTCHQLRDISYQSHSSTIRSSRSRTPGYINTTSNSTSECPPECPYFRVGRLPCQRHERKILAIPTQMGAQKRPSNRVEFIDHVVDLKRIHRVPESCIHDRRSPSPPPLPPKPDDNRPYLPYVGQAFDV